jgi:hypothetical protein
MTQKAPTGVYAPKKRILGGNTLVRVRNEALMDMPRFRIARAALVSSNAADQMPLT